MDVMVPLAVAADTLDVPENEARRLREREASGYGVSSLRSSMDRSLCDTSQLRRAWIITSAQFWTCIIALFRRRIRRQ